MKTVVIFGGSGFVGRHIIRRLSKKGYKIIIPYQRQVNEPNLRLLGEVGQIILIRYKSINEIKILELLENAGVVINLKTQWNEKKINFNQGILDFNIKITNILKKNTKKTKFIYFSGIGIDKDNVSKRSGAIYKSENYILENLINSIIIRPSVIIGGGDSFLKGLIPLFKFSFVIPLFGSGNSKFQPIYIDDVSKAVVKIIENYTITNKIFEFTGNEIFTYKQFYQLISSTFKSKRFIIPVPLFLIKIIIFILEKTTFSPINREQLRLFTKDNIAVKSHNQLLDLKITAQDTKEILRRIIIKNS